MEKISKATRLHNREAKLKEIENYQNEINPDKNNTELFTGLLDAILADWQIVDKTLFS